MVLIVGKIDELVAKLCRLLLGVHRECEDVIVILIVAVLRTKLENEL